MTNDDLFGSWLERTRELQIKSYGTDPATLTGDERARYFVTMSHALTVELGELAAEIGHKAWGTDRGIARENYIKELVDVGHFFANLAVLAGVTDYELNAAYLAKMKKNEERMASQAYSGRRKDGEGRDD